MALPRNSDDYAPFYKTRRWKARQRDEENSSVSACTSGLRLPRCFSDAPVFRAVWSNSVWPSVIGAPEADRIMSYSTKSAGNNRWWINTMTKRDKVAAERGSSVNHSAEYESTLRELQTFHMSKSLQKAPNTGVRSSVPSLAGKLHFCFVFYWHLLVVPSYFHGWLSVKSAIVVMKTYSHGETPYAVVSFCLSLQISVRSPGLEPVGPARTYSERSLIFWELIKISTKHFSCFASRFRSRTSPAEHSWSFAAWIAVNLAV